MDESTFTDINHPNYHEAGTKVWALSFGGFVHAEYAPTNWVTLTAGLRLDYNNITDFFISPRLASVFQPVENQYIRLSAARAFRKPSGYEAYLHLDLAFPPESPLQTPGEQYAFREFSTRVIGNTNVENEELWSFEAGYLGEFLDERLRVSLDLYFNQLRHELYLDLDIVTAANGLPDIENSSGLIRNSTDVYNMAGGELLVRYDVTKDISLMAFWDHRYVSVGSLSNQSDETPKNLFGLGGRFLLDPGFIGSFYMFSRSEFTDRRVANPMGIMAPPLKQHIDHAVTILGHLGYKFRLDGGFQMQTGFKIVMPISFSAPHFRLREEGGGLDQYGNPFGGREMGRMITGYLEGSF